MKWISRQIVGLQKFTHRIWYLPLIALLAAIDLFILVIPTDGLLISSVMLRPKRWISSFLWVSLGSAVGALALAILIFAFGDTVIQTVGVYNFESEIWIETTQFMQNYGLLTIGVFAVGILPLQPGVILAAATGMPSLEIFLSVFAGRAIKYAFFAWCARHVPSLLGRIWGVRREVKRLSLDMAKQPSP